jgi:vesicle-fusing ATPase
MHLQLFHAVATVAVLNTAVGIHRSIPIPPLRVCSPCARRSSHLVARITNSASAEAAGFTGQSLRNMANPKEETPKEPRKRIQPEQPDMTNPTETFDALCRMCGEPEGEDAELDFDGFALAFEQLFNAGNPMAPDVVDALSEAVGISDDNHDVRIDGWSAFHQEWLAATSMGSHLSSTISAKRSAEELEAALVAEKKRAAEAAAAREKEWGEALAKANDKLVKAKAEMEAQRKNDGASGLLANKAAAAKKKQGKWFEERESAALAAAQYRSLDPENWFKVVEGVGGLDAALEQIRRRVWTPLCAPRSLLDELGTERLKGLLLYGPPGCGKSYLAARLSKGLSRRPVTVVSGPEIMDKYIGGSEAQLRKLFTEPPPVEHRPGDASDVMMIAEANELHVVVLDEFDAIARQRGDGSGSSDSAARDSVVNQLLVLMDGVSDLPVPTFVIALTNRRELVDSAILRPGRLEVQVKVGQPDESGRDAIFKIHAGTMRESGRLSLDDEGAASLGGEDGCTLERVDDASWDAFVADVATQTEGFSGAALAAIVRAAVARALDRAVTLDDTAGCRVTSQDFKQAIADVRSSQLELERLQESKK